MRVAVGGLFHETNTFVASETTIADFEAYQFFDGAGLFALRQTGCEVAGFLAGCDEYGWEPQPALFAAAVPGGPVADADYAALADRLVDGLTRTGLPDAVLLCLHGAMATSLIGDADGALLTRIAQVLGPDVPIVATLDLHSNTSDAMANAVDALVAYDTYPHVDMYSRGREAAAVLRDVLRSGMRRSTLHRKAGLITAPQVQYTDTAPMKAIMRRVHELEKESGALISLTQGFPYADVDCLGVSVVVSSDDAGETGQIAAEVIEEVDLRRDEFRFSALSVEEAVDRALAAEGPVVLVDSADNVGAGAPGDGTAILEEWLRRGGDGLIVALTDPEAVAATIAAGVGSEVRLSVGAKTDQRHGNPVSLTARVRLISDGRYVHRGTYNPGFVTHMGRSVVVETSGNTVLLTERRVMPFDAHQLLSVGVSPLYCRALVVKSAIAWRAAYGEYARKIIEVDAPGVCTANLERLNLRSVRPEMIRPLLVRQMSSESESI